MVKVAGMDPSTKTGLVVLDYVPGKDMATVKYEDVLTAAKDVKGLDRAGDIAEKMLRAMDFHKPDLVVIEDYGFNNAHTLATLVEVGTVLRYFLKQRGQAVRLCAPTTLKKFVLGKGVGKKDEIRLGVYKRWSFEHKSDDVVDAYALAQMARALLDPNGTKLTKPQIEALGKTYPLV